MRILYVAEIVGKPGIHCIKSALATLRKEREVDLVIANGDGATGGYGIGKNHTMYLRKLGVDVITGGDQTFYKKDMADHIDTAYHVLRPANLPPDMPGRGWRHYSVRPGDWKEVENSPPEDESADGSPEGEPATPAVQVAVVSLLGQSGYDRIHAASPYHWLNHTIDRLRKNAVAVILDFHALTTAEKYTMFHFADGMVTAVFGSGQRVQTADAQVLPSGTAVICDAGRTGSARSVAGFAPGPEIRGYTSGLPERSAECWDDLQLQGALLEVDPASGYVTAFEALQIPCAPPARPQEG